MADKPTNLQDTSELKELESQYPQIDFKKFIALINDNYTTYELSAECDISQTTAWRIKSRLNKANKIIYAFKRDKLDVMLSTQLTAITLQVKIIEFYLQDSEFADLTNKEKIMLLMATNRIAGTLEDKQLAIVNIKGDVNLTQVIISPTEAKELQDESAEEMARTVLTSVKEIAE